jgi:tetratricopeptide (TPR) repeat protein
MIAGTVRVILVAAVLVVSGCASNPPAAVVTAPRYPSYRIPAAPAALNASPQVLAQHEAAWQRFQAGDLRGAAREFGRILQQAPDFYPAETAWGFVDLAGREFESAANRFQRALSTDGTYLPAWQGLADAQLESGDEVAAITSLERVVALDPGQEAALRGRIELLRFRQVQALMSSSQEARSAGRLDEAVASLERALILSPTSVVILRDLAGVERERGDLDGALVHARRAVDLDASDAEAHATLGAVLEARSELAAASGAYARAAALDDRADWRARSADLSERAKLASLPAEFGALPTATTVTRAQLAALIGVRLEALLAAAPRRVTEVATDVRGHWAAPWILPVTQAGVMEIFPNHTFQPGGLVRRGDLARIAYELLALASADRPSDLAKWSGETPRFVDLPPSHLVYRAAATAVTAGVMTTSDGRFAPTRPVTGGEVLAAVARLNELSNR